MKKNKSVPQDAAELRAQAEARLKSDKTLSGIPETKEDIIRLVHELQVHQIELEMQNEELQSTRAEIEELLERYTDLFDFAPIGYFTLDCNGIILKLNLSGAQLLGMERSRLVGGSFRYFVSDKFSSLFDSFLKWVFESFEQEFCEIALKEDGKDSIYLHMHSTISKNGRECRVIAQNITELKQTETALRIALAEIRTMRGIVPICANCKKIRDEHGKWNPVAEYVTDHTEAEFTHGLCPQCEKKIYENF